MTAPDTWRRTTVGEISSTIQYGYTASATSRDTGVRFLRITDIQDGKVDWGRVPYCKIEPGKLAKYALDKGDLLFARTGATVGKSFLIQRDPGRAVFASYLIRVRPTEAVDVEFLAQFFNSPAYWQQISAGSVGIGQPNVNGTVLSKLELPLPPLNEQRRIVAKIEELFSDLDAAIAPLKKAKEQLKTYRQAVLKWAFEGKLTEHWRKENNPPPASELLEQIKEEREKKYKEECAKARKEGKRPPRKPKELPPISEEELAELPVLPEGWEWVRLGSLPIEVLDGPFGSHLKSRDYVDSGIRVARLENIGYLKFIEEKRTYVSVEKYATISKHTVLPGDIVFSSFVADSTRAAIVPSSLDKAVNKADCFCVRAAIGGVNTHYLHYYLSTKTAHHLLSGQVHGATRPRVNTTQLKECPVPLAHPNEQRAVTMCVDQCLSEADKLEANATEAMQSAEALRQSILSRAFEGRLVSQSLSDQPNRPARSYPASPQVHIVQSTSKRTGRNPL